jgi:hypothetical protein
LNIFLVFIISSSNTKKKVYKQKGADYMLIELAKAWEDSGYGRKYYRDVNTNKLYVQQEESEGCFCWYTAVDDDCWSEPEALIKDNIEIRIIGEEAEEQEEMEKQEKFKFQYMMLDRLRSDVEYFLGWGEKIRFDRLINKNPQDHISKMKALYNILPVKPQWLSYEKILEYEKELIKE